MNFARPSKLFIDKLKLFIDNKLSKIIQTLFLDDNKQTVQNDYDKSEKIIV